MRRVLNVFIAAWVVIVLCAAVGSTLEGRVATGSAVALTLQILAIVAFIVQLICIPPLFVRLFLRLHRKVGNAKISRVVSNLEIPLVVTLYLLWGMGGLVGGGYLLLSPDTQPAFVKRLLHRSAGVLYFELGATLEDLQRRSTVVLPHDNVVHGSDILATAQSPFDLQLGERGPLLPGCRYYWISTKDKQPPLRVYGANLGISPEKLKKPEFDAYVRDVGKKLEASGWLRGHFDYSLSDHPEWHRGAPDGDGSLWARGDTFMRLLSRRMDDEKRDEPAGSGEFILYAEIGPRKERATKDMVFQAPR